MNEGITLHGGDWLVVLGYMTLMFCIPFLLRHRERSASDFFLAGGNMHWVFVGLSMYATLFSAISFVSMPGEAYKNGMLYALYSVGYTLVSPVAIWLFLRFFYNASSFSAYEYLERRFNLPTRVLGSLVFLISRALYASLALYSAAKVFESLIGWPPVLTVAVIIVVVIVYSFIGGMRTVIIADSIKTGFLILGLLVIVWKLSVAVGFDFAGAWAFATATHHGFGAIATPEFFSLDPHLRLTVWVLALYAVTTPLMNYGTDQLFIQKILAANSYRGAFRASLLKTYFALPLTLLFYGAGILLYYYYNGLNRPPEGVHPDAMLGYFIGHHMPSPLPGVVTVALLAAVMSSLDSTISSLSTIISVDIVERLNLLRPGRVGLFALGRGLTVAWGVVISGLAGLLIWKSEAVESTIAELAVIWSSLWGVLLVIVLGGVFTSWITGRAAAVALGIGIVLNLVLPWPLYYATPAAERISFAWVGVPGWIATAIILVAVSACDRRKNTQLEGLTWKTVRHP